MNPFLKNNMPSHGVYDMIFQLIWVIPARFRSLLLVQLKNEIKEIRQKLFRSSAEE
jgi:hypothetical protein